MPLLDCKIGDEVYGRGRSWIVTGFHTVSGDLYVETSDKKQTATITTKTSTQWERVK